jgi:hypothetical protein
VEEKKYCIISTDKEKRRYVRTFDDDVYTLWENRHLITNPTTERENVWNLIVERAKKATRTEEEREALEATNENFQVEGEDVSYQMQIRRFQQLEEPVGFEAVPPPPLKKKESDPCEQEKEQLRRQWESEKKSMQQQINDAGKLAFQWQQEAEQVRRQFKEQRENEMKSLQQHINDAEKSAFQWQQEAEQVRAAFTEEEQRSLQFQAQNQQYALERSSLEFQISQLRDQLNRSHPVIDGRGEEEERLAQQAALIQKQQQEMFQERKKCLDLANQVSILTDEISRLRRATTDVHKDADFEVMATQEGIIQSQKKEIQALSEKEVASNVKIRELVGDMQRVQEALKLHEDVAAKSWGEMFMIAVI